MAGAWPLLFFASNLGVMMNYLHTFSYKARAYLWTAHIMSLSNATLDTRTQANLDCRRRRRRRRRRRIRRMTERRLRREISFHLIFLHHLLDLHFGLKSSENIWFTFTLWKENFLKLSRFAALLNYSLFLGTCQAHLIVEPPFSMISSFSSSWFRLRLLLQSSIWDGNFRLYVGASILIRIQSAN